MCVFFVIGHESTRTRAKPYKFEICGNAFYLHFLATVLERIHTVEKLYKCETCAKAFDYIQLLHIMREFKLERRLSNVEHVPKPLISIPL